LGKCIISPKKKCWHESFLQQTEVFNKGKIYVITGKEKGQANDFLKVE
jgi:hypothetical protein